MKKEFKCEVCGAKYESYIKGSKTCSRKCHGKRLSRLYAGRKLTPEWLARINAHKRRDSVRKEGDFPCEKCGKHFGSNTSLRSHMAYCSAESEARDVRCEVCGEVMKRARGLKWHMKKHEPGYLEEHIRKTKEGIAKRAPMKNTSGDEFVFLEILRREHGDEVIHKFRIDGINHEYDFFIPSRKLIVELDGDYWHGNPARYELDDRMRKQHRIDDAFREKAEAAGYCVRRVWVSEMASYKGDE